MLLPFYRVLFRAAHTAKQTVSLHVPGSLGALTRLPSVVIHWPSDDILDILGGTFCSFFDNVK